MIETYLANHENLVGLGKLGKLLQRRHESLVVVPSSSRIDEDDIVALLGRMANGIFGNSSGILAISLLVQLHLSAFSSRELLEVSHVYGELLNSAGTESITSSDEDFVFVL